MQDNQISAIRAQIDDIDNELVRLISARAEAAKQIGQLKEDTGTAVYDPHRERSVLDRIDELNHGPLDKGAIEEVFGCIITACREVQMQRKV